MRLNDRKKFVFNSSSYSLMSTAQIIISAKSLDDAYKALASLVFNHNYWIFVGIIEKGEKKNEITSFSR